MQTTRAPEPVIGFIGLGNIGQPMAHALLRAGHEVVVHDREPSRADACVAEGATASDDFSGCDIVALAVPDDAAVESVLDGLTGDPLVIVHSTILPATAKRLAAGRAVVDAPVSGGPDRAAEGDLTVFVGGEEADVARARPVLDAVASDVRHVGGPGAGAAVKLANQLMLFSALAGAYEALDFARAHGVEEQVVLDAVSTSTGDSWAARNWGFFERVARAYDEGGTPVKYRPWGKDLYDVVLAAREVDVEVPVAALLSQTLAARVERP
ncbi:MAG TPA: NAD(P)-dependent oxidoreductase [Solirubrobacter sp.]|nr:NAD(P)-dependent oxidoreductase [Solirubrobacter sp.]